MENNILLKLRKLIAHQQSAAAMGSQQEAEAFAGRIQELLSKHKLSMTDLEAKEEEELGVTSGLAVDPTRFGMKDKDSMISWLVQLAQGIAKVNDCEVLVQNVMVTLSKAEQRKTGKMFGQKPTNKFIFVGIEADRTAAEEFYVYMAKLVWELAGKAGDDVKEGFRKEITFELGRCAPGHLSAKLHDFRHSYCKGFVVEVNKRLKEEREKQKAAALNMETGLMVIDRRALMVRTYLSKNSVKATSADYYKKGQQNLGYTMGALQGQKVALTAKVVK